MEQSPGRLRPWSVRLKTEPQPGTGLRGWLFVPTSVRSRVLQWGHATCLTCHPRIHCTITFLQRYFWWPTLIKDATEYVKACSTCAHNKLSHHPPSGLLLTLSTPGRPWAHISLDFITGLPPSSGNTAIVFQSCSLRCSPQAPDRLRGRPIAHYSRVQPPWHS